MGMQMNYPPTRLPASERKTFSILMPAETHWRKATCEEVACPRFLEGWQVRVELITPEDRHRIKQSKWRYTELRPTDGQTLWVFEAGQPCFQARNHRIQLDKPQLYVVRDGDRRGNPRGTPVLRHKRAESWVDQFSEHQDKLARAIEQG